MTTPDLKHFLVFITRYFFASKRPGLKDFVYFLKWRNAGPQKLPTIHSHIIVAKQGHTKLLKIIW